jgi:hypothetical protein
MNIPISGITLLENMRQADFDKLCDAIEAEIARLENIDYASREARALLDVEAKIVARRYEASK